MTGGISGYRGYTYQTLVFLNELLKNLSISGELEKGDDFLIKKKEKIIVCFQTKDYSEPLKSKDVQKFIPNFIKSYNFGARRFIIHSPFGVIKKLDLKDIFLKLEEKDKISKKELAIAQKLEIDIIKKSRKEIETELKMRIGDIIKDSGGSILSGETEKIAEKISGVLFTTQKEFTKKEILDLIIKEGVPFVRSLPKESLKNSSDLSTKYLEEDFETCESDKAIHFLTKFYLKKKNLSQNPSLQEKFSEFYFRIGKHIQQKKLNKIKLDKFRELIKKLIKSKEIELERFIEGDDTIVEEIYNSLIGECYFRPKK